MFLAQQCPRKHFIKTLDPHALSLLHGLVNTGGVREHI